jgi:hypothetical protein
MKASTLHLVKIGITSITSHHSYSTLNPFLLYCKFVHEMAVFYTITDNDRILERM